MNHLRWIILVAACFGCVGCERFNTADDDLRAEAPGVTPRRDMPGTDITDPRRADMPQQRADMPRDQPQTEQQRMEQQIRDQQAQQQQQQRADRPGGTGQMASAAVQAIANARCEREQRCGNIGAGEDFATNEACLAEIRRDWADELSAYECPGGVEQTELTSCVQEIRAEDCDSPFDTLARVVECRSTAICEAG